MALMEDRPFKGLALAAQKEALVCYESDGVYSLALDNASRMQAICDVHWNALLAEEQKVEQNQRLIMELSQRLIGYLQKATAAWVHCEELRQARDAGVVDYEKILAERRRDDGHS